jgi:hypothetical protein
LKFSFSLFISKNIKPSCQLSQQVRKYPLAEPLLAHKEILLSQRHEGVYEELG